jgi:hypothetical protein
MNKPNYVKQANIEVVLALIIFGLSWYIVLDKTGIDEKLELFHDSMPVWKSFIYHLGIFIAMFLVGRYSFFLGRNKEQKEGK